jgi:hypothetical protein
MGFEADQPAKGDRAEAAAESDEHGRGQQVRTLRECDPPDVQGESARPFTEAKRRHGEGVSAHDTLGRTPAGVLLVGVSLV